ncbi:Uncharacterized protein OBRU01_09365 [Operophtera brumata]|uniref:Protein rolling stone n=1 Tax=Operophtera brumata TaxID=104452 RepID=A0A0L7LFH1_OPEBR|nr:Uncharacterized protein OBRU01_09365 [Operophtera brumata]
MFTCVLNTNSVVSACFRALLCTPTRGITPLWWRLPILLWSLMVVFWSMAFFWGPTEKYFLYMTHWGLLFIVKQCVWRMCLLEHPLPSNFYVSSWQTNRSSLPLLLLRSFLFLFSTCVLLASVTLPLTTDVRFGFWFIYLSNWGLLLIVLTMAFSTSVCGYVYFKRPIDATFGLPWYVKTYWVLYNITIPVAFLITVFYWGVLKTSTSVHVNYAPNPILDVMVHGINSVVMLVELICSAHPSRLLHIMQPLYFAAAYMLFSVIYYFAGGTDPWGNPFIYPVVDWSKPGQTMVVITLTGLFLALMHLLTVAVATGRDAIVSRRLRDTAGVYNDGEFQGSMFGLEEENASQFYVSCFQRNRSAVPLMLIRFIVFMGCLGILLASTIMTGNAIPVKYWFIFLTHWGLVFITATSDATFGLPWYIKAYWVTYNLTMPIAFFITLFYWALLTGVEEDFAINKTLDIFIHGINSVLMMALLVSSSHPSRLLHFYHAVLAGIVYLIFSIIYYFAGGVLKCYTNTTILKMSGLKKYLKEEFDLRTLVLQHSKPAEFYLSSWQTTRSVVPLLIWRTILFLTSVGIVLSSMIIYILNGIYGYWFIYLTHWGLTVILFATGFALLVSARCYFYGPISAEFVLPWYVKTYWVLHNIAVPVAFLITIFYWTILYEAGIEEELSHGLDIAVHGLNSLVMFLLLISTDGSRWVYPVVNWANPGPTIGVCAITGLLLALLHLLTVGIAVARDAVARKLVKPSETVNVEEGYPLRRPAQTT